ncbi:hypothetical protein DOTSEDRAFT_19040 [Dothistroma septosporum NZE10]|uniref:Uncharacterized protein n=1 Tax=Dothistroma septosporum (strain NZE10 / CBS 128990) TaxID=675120 RepID=N1PYB5_DOTSN|nr:hypothetical protein DOTSEDRAFT_19040 [Dothistroma septosporum NZE10]
MKTPLVLFFGYTAAAVLPRANVDRTPTAAATPGAVVVRRELSGTVTASWTSNGNSTTSTASSSVITAAPTLDLVGPDGGSPCTPHSICVDKATMMDCGSGLVRKRYGGCYDVNFCTATKSYDPPGCD